MFEFKLRARVLILDWLNHNLKSSIVRLVNQCVLPVESNGVAAMWQIGTFFLSDIPV